MKIVKEKLNKTNIKFLLETLSSKYKFNLSIKQKKDIWFAIRNQRPILFLGEARTGKTALARALQEHGILAYAPEMFDVIRLGAGRGTVANELKGFTGIFTQW